MAEASPGKGGINTRGILSSSANWTAWTGPAPPKATSTYSRGSSPLETVTRRRASTIWELTILTMPLAAAIESRPNGSATLAAMARSAAA